MLPGGRLTQLQEVEAFHGACKTRTKPNGSSGEVEEEADIFLPRLDGFGPATLSVVDWEV